MCRYVRLDRTSLVREDEAIRWLTVCACWIVGQELDIRHSRILVPSTRSDADAPDEDAHILHTAL